MNVLLIPSAILVPKEMRNKLGDLPSILYPLNGVPMLHHIYKQYEGKVDKIYIVICKKKELVCDYVGLKKMPIDIVELEALKDLGYTIYHGIKKILLDNEQIDNLYINYADTLIDNSIYDPTSENVIYYDEVNVSEDWTYFKQAGKVISHIWDKKANNRAEIKSTDTFVGVFKIKNTVDLYNILENEMQNNHSDCDSFYCALQKYGNKCGFDFEKTVGWFDSGHSENYMKAKTGVEARSFNSIIIDEKRGILRKTSQNKDKFIDEITWYLKMPNKLQYLLPRIYNYSLERSYPYVEMEYYGYNTLHELLVYGEVELYKWQGIFEKILFIINDMERYELSGYEKEKYEAMQEIYVKKTIERLKLLKEDPAFSCFFENDITVNNKRYHSLNWYLERLPSVIENQVIVNSNVKFNVIHGDLCFSNILLENNYGFLRIIDPRGKFGSFDIYGDSRYEIAKLLHSIEGKYDFIIEDMFDINVVDNNINFTIGKDTRMIQGVFRDVFKSKLSEDDSVNIIESMLFLSMIPLHSNSLLRQYAMLATGLELLGDI
jgi:hypothetical protein